jgi:catechol 2,3-dioxygenase-like lactoylglutathione lyase family enzyme
MQMKYEGVCIAVKDINLSKKFYQDLFRLEILQDYGINISFGGLSLQQEFDWLTGVPKESISEKSHNMELYFEEDDFDDFMAELEKHNNIQYIGDGVKEAGWGQRSIRFYDLDGHIIEVGENMKMVVKRFLDSGMSMEETSKRMDISISDLEILLCS